MFQKYFGFRTLPSASLLTVSLPPSSDRTIAFTQPSTTEGIHTTLTSIYLVEKHVLHSGLRNYGFGDVWMSVPILEKFCNVFTW
jgi:hypothetical protein